jgi:hypothetical protein
MRDASLLLTLLAAASGCGSRTGLLLPEESPPGDDAGEAGESGPAGPVGSAPRPVAPLSTSTVTTRTPTLRWTLAAGTDGAIVDLCHDRACSRVLDSFSALGTSAKVPTSLPPGVVFWRLRGTAHGGPGGFSPTWQFTVGRRSAPVDASWGSTLDVNGDGLADVVVGADAANDYAGAAYLYMGGASGLGTPPHVLPLPPKASNFGGVVGSAGDVDGDGFGDLLIAGGTAGAAYVYLGGPSGISMTPQTIAGPSEDGFLFGSSAASAGDVDGDGYGDLIVGAYSHDSYSGAAYLYRGGPGGLTGKPLVLLDPDTTPEDDEFGSTVASAGDVNGDGYGDLAVNSFIGSPNMSGPVYVYLGGPSGPSTAPSYRLGVTSFHVSVADTNGDGYADVLASDDGGHAIDVFFGGPSGPAAPPPVLNVGGLPMTGSYGASVAGAGDVDGDGFEDVLAGGYTGNVAFLFRGGASGPDATPLTLADAGSSPNDTFGLAVAGASDVDGDGFDDVLVGAPGMTLQVGRAYLFFGSPSGPRTPPTVVQDPANGQLDLFGDALQ